MFVARIEGFITSTVRHPSFKNCSLLLCRRLDADGRAIGEPQVVLDQMSSGYGSEVLVSTDGDLARQILNDNTTPSRLVVVGLVDTIAREQ